MSNPIDIKELREKVKIDREKLEYNLAEQPSLYFDYRTKLAALKIDYEKQKLALQETEAQLSRYYREQIQKATEKAIESYIVTDPRWKEQMEKLQNCKAMLLQVESIVDTLEQRKDVLQSLVKLITDKKQL